jgi:diadenosine tetraphosphate (Ap4A) HIT family hydrolase
MCVFCNLNKEEYLFENDTCFAKYDNYPVSPGHILIIPKRHFQDFFEANTKEYQDILELINICKMNLVQQYHSDGFNLGVNIGEAAGQTVMHLHVHLIPRYMGDIEDPRGGVRGVIPEKRIYHT